MSKRSQSEKEAMLDAKAEQYLGLLDWFDNLPPGGWVIKGEALQRFKKLYCLNIHPSYLKYYSYSIAKIGEELQKAIKAGLEYSPPPKTGKRLIQSEAIRHILTLMPDEPEWDTPGEIAAAVFPIVWLSRVRFIHFLCLLKFGKSPAELRLEATFGQDDKSCLRLIKLDAGFLADEFGQFLVRRCELDATLKAKLSKALAPDPKFFRITERREDFKFYLLQLLKFPGSYNAWYDFQMRHDICSYDNPEAFEAACRRFFKKLEKSKPRAKFHVSADKSLR